MAKIGFIGASGLMGHGMAKNLLAKGHTVALTVHRNRERVADLLAAGATEGPQRPGTGRRPASSCSSASPARRRSRPACWAPTV
jgi:NAD(P)-dependent dehydrogenase (short-subunit alcohol dehydrogenase family)